MKTEVGDIIRIIKMKDEPSYNGKEGTVTHIDDLGQIHGTWGGCALIPEIDKFEVIDTLEASLSTKISHLVKEAETIINK